MNRISLIARVLRIALLPITVPLGLIASIAQGTLNLIQSKYDDILMNLRNKQE